MRYTQYCHFLAYDCENIGTIKKNIETAVIKRSGQISNFDFLLLLPSNSDNDLSLSDKSDQYSSLLLPAPEHIK